jgi:hypothetical protein
MSPDMQRFAGELAFYSKEHRMELNVVAAGIAGLIGTAVMTGMMLGARRLDLPAVDAHGILGYLKYADRASSLGYIAHFGLGVLLALGYGLIFARLPGNILALGAGLGALHWLLVGWMFAFAPLAHAGMKAGTIQPTGPYMLGSLGLTGFMAGLAGHIVFGLTVAAVYAALG